LAHEPISNLDHLNDTRFTTVQFTTNIISGLSTAVVSSALYSIRSLPPPGGDIVRICRAVQRPLFHEESHKVPTSSL